jgi:mRNA-degrading endonuclease RelE of RelBE toxin-antitoxin system
MEIVQTLRFKKAYKKLAKNQLATVNEAIRTIVKDPRIGEQKKVIYHG